MVPLVIIFNDSVRGIILLIFAWASNSYSERNRTEVVQCLTILQCTTTDFYFSKRQGAHNGSNNTILRAVGRTDNLMEMALLASHTGEEFLDYFIR